MSNIVPFQRVQRADAFINRVTGYGTSRDHGEQFGYQAEPRKSTHTLDSLYADHPICWKLVDLLPDDGLREWIDINHDRADEIKQALIFNEARQALNEALKMARLHGGAAIYLQVDDGMDPSEPLRPERVRGLISCEVIEKDYLSPQSYSRRMRSELYLLAGGEEDALLIHRSRLLFFHGARVSRDWMLNNNGWGQSVVARCWKPLLAYSLSHSMVPAILKDFVRDVLKLDGLNLMSLGECNEEGQQDFNMRLDGMLIAQSLFNKLVLDTNDEYERTTTNVAGLTDLIRNPERALVAASGIPHTKLLGEAPQSSIGGQAGGSQEKDWFKSVSAYQEDHIRPALDRIVLLVSLGLGIREQVEYTFNPLDTPTVKEQAEIFKLVTEAAAKGVDAQIFSPQEAATLYEGSEIRTIPVLDMDARAGLEQMTAEFLEQAVTPPQIPQQEASNDRTGSPQESQV